MLKYEDEWVTDPQLIEAIQRLESRGVIRGVQMYIRDINCPRFDAVYYSVETCRGSHFGIKDITEVFPL
jgi:DNA-binding Lrp family transcriptional regulator